MPSRYQTFMSGHLFWQKLVTTEYNPDMSTKALLIQPQPFLCHRKVQHHYLIILQHILSLLYIAKMLH